MTMLFIGLGIGLVVGGVAVVGWTFWLLKDMWPG